MESVPLEKILDNFLNKVSETSTVWALQDNESYAVSVSNEFETEDGDPAGMVCFWSDKQLAKASAVDDWQNHEPVKIQLGDFVENFCIGIAHDGLMVGIDFNENMIGLEIDAFDLILEISKHLKRTKKQIVLTKYKNLEELVQEIKMIQEE